MIQLEHPGDAVCFDVGFTWPPRDLTVPEQVSMVCESVDEEHGIVTYRSVRPCELQWPLQECER